MFVLTGSIEVDFSAQTLRLRNSRSLGGKYAEVLVVVTGT